MQGLRSFEPKLWSKLIFSLSEEEKDTWLPQNAQKCVSLTGAESGSLQ